MVAWYVPCGRYPPPSMQVLTTASLPQVRAEWTLPSPQAEPISLAYTAWPAAALGAHADHHGARTAHHGAPTVSLGRRAEGLPEPISAPTLPISARTLPISAPTLVDMQPPVTAHLPVGMHAPITARRLVAGDGERKSTLLLELTSYWARPVRVDVVDELPHWVQPYWHTLRCWRNGSSIRLDEALKTWRIRPASAPAPPLPRAIELYASDAVATRAPHQFRWSADLPAGPASLVVAFDLLKPVRHIDSMPADASRGLDIGSAAVAYSEVARGAAGPAGAPKTAPTPDEPPPQQQLLLFSNAVVVMLPIADDSMPYNVIAVSSTLIALFVGQVSLVNCLLSAS